MRKSFAEFYQPSPEEEQRFILSGVVVIDTNVLLGLYRMTSAERDKVLDVFETIGERLWIPYQVGLEYQRNRLNVIQKQASFYGRLTALHGIKDLDHYVDILDKTEVPSEVKEEVRPLLAPLRQSLLEAADGYIETVKNIISEHVVPADQAGRQDPVRERLDALLDGKVGSRADADIQEGRVKQGIQRIGTQTPPGYKDGSKDGDEQRAGDYLLWAELLDHAASAAAKDVPFVLVTNDTKEDWYQSSNGQVVGPRPELVREFAKHNPNGYHQVTLEGLLRLANVHLAAEVDEATLEKASELARPDAFSTADAYDLARRISELSAATEQARLLTLNAAQHPTVLDPALLRQLQQVTKSQMLKSVDPATIRTVSRSLRSFAETYPRWADAADDPSVSDENDDTTDPDLD